MSIGREKRSVKRGYVIWCFIGDDTNYYKDVGELWSTWEFDMLSFGLRFSVKLLSLERDSRLFALIWD